MTKKPILKIRKPPKFYPINFEKLKGKNKGEIKETKQTYEVSGGEYVRECDWYEIVYLGDWTDD
jgi:hypothetical protein